MTKEEAIQFLSQIMDALLASNSWLPSTDNPIKESFGMAINALKAQEQLSNKSPELDSEFGELISRQEAVDEIDEWIKAFRENGHKESAADACLIQDGIIQLPPAQPEQTNCGYCREDVDGYVKPIEKNGHAFVSFGMNGWELELKAKGWHGDVKIQYCPMCGRKLKNDK
jgi:hypothetical protein